MRAMYNNSDAKSQFFVSSNVDYFNNSHLIVHNTDTQYNFYNVRQLNFGHDVWLIYYESRDNYYNTVQQINALGKSFRIQHNLWTYKYIDFLS